jgi:hypothetical protein
MEETTNEKEQTSQEENSGTEEAIENSKVGEPTMLEEHRAERKKFEAVRDEIRKENDRKEKLIAEEALGGRSGGGEIPAKVEETPEDYAKKVMSGEVGEK